jgi:hypothetical protein
MPTTVDLRQEAGQEKRGDGGLTSERRRLAELRQGGLSMEQLRAVALLKRRLAVNYLWEARRLKMVQLELRGSVEKKGGGRSEHHRWRKGERRKGRAGLLTGGEGSLEKEEGSCGAAHWRRGVSTPIYRGGAAGRRVVGEGIQPSMAAIKVSKVERHRGGGELEGLHELYDCC